MMNVAKEYVGYLPVFGVKKPVKIITVPNKLVNIVVKG